MQAKKSLGQNFLVNDAITDKIASLFIARENDLIMEIGPGRGALTEKLAKKPSKLLCIEIDRDTDAENLMHKYYYDKTYKKKLGKKMHAREIKQILKDIDFNRDKYVFNIKDIKDISVVTRCATTPTPHDGIKYFGKFICRELFCVPQLVGSRKHYWYFTADKGLIDFDNSFIVENVEYSSGNVETFINPARYPNLGNQNNKAFGILLNILYDAEIIEDYDKEYYKDYFVWGKDKK